MVTHGQPSNFSRQRGGPPWIPKGSPRDPRAQAAIRSKEQDFERRKKAQLGNQPAGSAARRTGQSQGWLVRLVGVSQG